MEIMEGKSQKSVAEFLALTVANPLKIEVAQATKQQSKQQSKKICKKLEKVRKLTAETALSNEGASPLPPCMESHETRYL